MAFDACIKQMNRFKQIVTGRVMEMMKRKQKSVISFVVKSRNQELSFFIFGKSTSTQSIFALDHADDIVLCFFFFFFFELVVFYEL